MSARPGAPEGVEDILTEILGELRAINAKLAHLPAAPTVDTIDWLGLMTSDEVLAAIEDASHPGRGVIV